MPLESISAKWYMINVAYFQNAFYISSVFSYFFSKWSKLKESLTNEAKACGKENKITSVMKHSTLLYTIISFDFYCFFHFAVVVWITCVIYKWWWCKLSALEVRLRGGGYQQHKNLRKTNMKRVRINFE